MGRPVVIVGISGGVDSAVAAALLGQQGYDVVGITMQLGDVSSQDSLPDKVGGCCSPGAVKDARAIASKLGIPHHILNMGERFERDVIDYFCQEYAGGRTPNPCTVCNSGLKFKILLDKALSLGADFIATGHYAQVRYDKIENRYVLSKAVDNEKDQSYALYGLNQFQLSHAMFPLGKITKAKTREIANTLNLDVAKKPDSQEICFISNNDYRDFLSKRIPDAIRPGSFVSRSGHVLGDHKGLPFYTIGQRRHLGVASNKRLYVLDMDVGRNEIVLGDESGLFHLEAAVQDVNWVGIKAPDRPIKADVCVRYQGILNPATVIPVSQTEVSVKFSRPARAPAPGQAAVFYRGPDVLGGGIIAKKDQSY